MVKEGMIKGIDLDLTSTLDFCKICVDAPMDGLPSGKHTQTHTQACDGVTDS